MIVWSCVCVWLSATSALAQGRGAGVWTTASRDAARSASAPADPRISRDRLGTPGFQFLWKRQLERQPKGPFALTQPVFSAPGLITYKGFKGLAYVGGASDAVYSIDYDLNRMFWTTKLRTASTTPGTEACPGAMTAVTEATTRPSADQGGSGRGRGLFGGGPRGAVAGVFVVSSGGMLHDLNLQDGTDWFTPVKLLPGPNATVTGAILVDSVMYVSTAGSCGGVPNGVYAMDLTPVPSSAVTPEGLPAVPVATPASTSVVRWETHGGGVVGVGPALSSDGTLYVATGDGAYSSTARSDAVVALEAKTLRQKDYFTPGQTAFTSSPVVFRDEGRDLVAAANQDGRVYVLDAASLGGADHRTPLARSAGGAGRIGGLATFADAGGTRWILAAASGAIQTAAGRAAHGAIVAFRLADRDGAPALEPAWVSRESDRPRDAGVRPGRGVRVVERRGTRRTTVGSRGPVCAGRGDREGIVEQRGDDHVHRARARAGGGRRSGVRRDG